MWLCIAKVATCCLALHKRRSLHVALHESLHVALHKRSSLHVHIHESFFHRHRFAHELMHHLILSVRISTPECKQRLCHSTLIQYEYEMHMDDLICHAWITRGTFMCMWAKISFPTQCLGRPRSVTVSCLFCEFTSSAF